MKDFVIDELNLNLPRKCPGCGVLYNEADRLLQFCSVCHYDADYKCYLPTYLVTTQTNL